MRIGLLVMTERWGGSELHTLQLAHTLAKRGHAPTVVCLTETAYQMYREHNPYLISVIQLPLTQTAQKMSFLDWMKVFGSQRYDVCALVKGSFWRGDWKLDLAARCRFGNYLTVEHLTGDPIPPKTGRRYLGFIPRIELWWYRDRFRRFFRSVGPRQVICVSEAGRKRLTEEYLFPARKVVTVRNGIDPDQFRPNPAHGLAWRQRWGISKDALVFGAVGRLSQEKGYETALAGFQALLKIFPDKDLHLALVAEGPQEQNLKAQAEQIVPRGRVTFSPFCSQPWEPLNALDVFVMPSRNEGLPLALMEAMACGCCPVAATVGGIPELVNSPEVGWLVPPGNEDAFAAAMADAASRTPEQRAVMGARARERVRNHFNAAIQFEKFADAIESLSRRAERAVIEQTTVESAAVPSARIEG